VRDGSVEALTGPLHHGALFASWTVEVTTMKRIARALGPILCVLALAASAACAAPTTAGPDRGNNSRYVGACKIAGTWCRWDDQCCSSRCYVDTGCSG
jgi:hypothetical protein